MIVKSGVVSVPFISGDKFQYNTTTGELWEKAKPPPGLINLLMQEVGRYVHWWNNNFYLHNTAASYRVSGSLSRKFSRMNSQTLAWNPR